MDSDYMNTGEEIEYRHIRYKETPDSRFHLHDGFEIYFLISGDVRYLIEKNVYVVEYGNVIITNNQELHRACIQSKKAYERITLIFNPRVVEWINNTCYDLLHCFVNRPKGEYNRISLNKKQIKHIYYFFNKFEALYAAPSESNDVLKTVYLIELLVFLNKIYYHEEENNVLANIPAKLLEVLNYIDNHLEADITLDLLKSQFYIDKFYLCKLFRKNLGSSINEYIICKRISNAKKLIIDGYSMTEVCSLCGFKDYSSFFRMFKKHIGLSPSQYKKLKS